MKLSDLCKVLDSNGLEASLEGADLEIRAVNTLDGAGEGEISFLSNPKYASAIETTGASALIVKPGVEVKDGVAIIRCADPYAAITVAIVAIHGYRKHPQWGISDKATIHASAIVGAGANIGPNVTISAGAKLGENCTIYPGCYIADGVTIGADCTLHPNVTIYDGCTLGNRVTIHSGTVIGEDGLGYAPIGETWLKIPQVGLAIIGDDVEIGANCSIDRATLGETSIGSGTKFGNGIVIGHGTVIGPNCMFVGQIGVAGSVRVGKHVTLAGQVGVVGHLTIGDNANVGGGSGVMKSIPPNMKALGTPAMEFGLALRSAAAIPKLPELVKRVRQLEAELAKLKAQTES